MILHCHNRRKLRIQAQADAETAVAAQISRGCIKEAIKGDNPPEYEQPPSYSEAICELKWNEVVEKEKKMRQKRNLSRTSKPESDSNCETTSRSSSRSRSEQSSTDVTKCAVPLENVQCYI